MASIESSGDHLPYKLVDGPAPQGWSSVAPMTGSHIPGVDTGARGGMTTFMSGGGLQTISSGMGSFGGLGGGAAMGGLRAGEGAGSSAAGTLGQREAGSATAGPSQQAVDAYDAHAGAPSYDVFGLGAPADTNSAAGAGPDYYAGSVGDLTRGVQYDRNGFAMGGSGGPGARPAAASWDPLNTTQTNDVRSIEDGVPWLGPGEWSSGTFQTFVDDNGDLNVVGNPIYGPNGHPETSGGQSVYGVPGTTIAPSASDLAEAGGAPASLLSRIDDRISGFNNIVNDELVDQGARALQKGDQAAFIWNGIKYSFYNTFMPDSAEGAAVAVAGGAVAGRVLGAVAKGAVELWPVLGRSVAGITIETSSLGYDISKWSEYGLPSDGYFVRTLTPQQYRDLLAGRQFSFGGRPVEGYPDGMEFIGSAENVSGIGTSGAYRDGLGLDYDPKYLLEFQLKNPTGLQNVLEAQYDGFIRGGKTKNGYYEFNYPGLSSRDVLNPRVRILK